VSACVGVQFIVGTEVKHNQQFRSPLYLDESSLSDIKVEMQQVIGIPANDMKQQLILGGIPSNSCICACAACTCERENFGRISERLWKLECERRLAKGGCPHKDAPK